MKHKRYVFNFIDLSNYFVVGHSATETACATSVDCHLIVTLLEILAMCPFIFRCRTLVDYDYDVRTFSLFSLQCLALILQTLDSFQSTSLPHLIFLSTRGDVNHAFDDRESREAEKNRKEFVPVER